MISLDRQIHTHTELTIKQLELELCRPLLCRYFSKVNATLLHNPQLVKPGDAEPQTRRNLGYGGPTISYMQIFLLGLLAF